MAILIAVDIGTTNLKSAAFTADGTPFALRKLPTKTHVHRDGYRYYDPGEIWRGVCELLRAIMADCAGEEILGVSVTSMSEAIVPLNQNGEAVFPILAWFDNCAHKEAQMLVQNLGAETVFAICGLDADAIFPLPKMMWIRSYAPKAYEKAVKWLQMTDYVYYKLCGVFATDYSMACRTLAYDIHTLSWSQQLMDAAQISSSVMPEVVKSGTYLGKISSKAVEETGLPPGTRVFVGGHDHPCATITSGCMSGQKMLDSAGTAESCLLLSKKGAAAPRQSQGARIGLYLDPARYVLWGGIKASGASADWAYQHLASSNDWQPQTMTTDYQAICEKYAYLPTGSEGVLYIPHLRGSGAPAWNALDKGAFIGLNDGHTTVHMVRAVFEGLSCQVRIIAEMHMRISRQQIEGVCVAGGSAKNRYWQQMKADLLHLPVEISPFEDATVHGAAMLAAIGAGVFSSIEEASEAMARNNCILTPDANNYAAYEKLYKRYCLANEQVSLLHRMLAEYES